MIAAALVAAALVAATPAVAAAGEPDLALPPDTVVSACDDLERWAAHPADGVSLDLALDEGVRGPGLRLDFAIPGGGYAVARIETDLVLSENYAFRFHIRGAAAVNHLEFKLIDETGDNVWWSVRRDFEFPTEWTRLSVKKRHLDFAWGPKGGGEIQRVAAIELAITAGQGGSGRVWIDEIELVPLAPPDAVPPTPVPSATSARAGNPPAAATDGSDETAWRPEAEDPEPAFLLDATRTREYSGVVLQWSEGRHASDYSIDASDDGVTWTTLRAVVGANGGRDAHFLPESESRYVRVRVPRTSGAEGPALAEIELKGVDWAESRQDFFAMLASEAPRGQAPRSVLPEQSYWTVVGVDADAREALLGEDGALELGRGLGSIEPFLHVDGQLVAWADVPITQSLEEGFLPIPSVRWEANGIDLRVTAFATGPPGASSVVVRYQVFNVGLHTSTPTLYLAVRPYQVNPASQTLNLVGGVATIHAIEWVDGDAIVDDRLRVRTLTPASAFGATTFDGGDIVADYLSQGRLPPHERASCEFGAASAALAYPLELQPGESRVVDLLVPLYPETAAPPSSARSEGWVERELDRCRARWRERTERVSIELPPVASDIALTLKSQLCYVLVNRAGPAIQPGARSYARSWIRDGALTSWAMLRLGHAEVAREFLEWYAPFQYEHGKIPCVVDSRGADPVDEHDSSGEFIFLVAELFRFTRDQALLEEMWPRVLKAADYLDALRRQRRTEEYARPEQAPFFGILPPSISHEGYSAKPMHSYWDDFFAVCGFRDAAFVANALGHREQAARLAGIRDEFERDLGASLAAAMRHHKIDHIPGCADLGDFDPTSTTIALSPAQAEGLLPEGALQRTFERYWEFFVDRRDGQPWDDFTPYELRSVGTFVRLGWRDRAVELLDFFLDQRRPVGWRQWPEVVRRDPRKSGFLGDLPHTWVGSDFLRSGLDMLAYERGDALVVGAGIPSDWLEPPGVTVRGLPTTQGTLDFSIVREHGDVRVDLDGTLSPLGTVELYLPVPLSSGEVLVNERRMTAPSEGPLIVSELPARVRVRF